MDAALILLREGLEALLVVVALLTFLKKSGNAAKQPWIWAGVGAGLTMSVLLAIAIQLIFGNVINPGNRELIEGITGLVAASMLIYVSYWMHSKSSAGAWQRYIKKARRLWPRVVCSAWPSCLSWQSSGRGRRRPCFTWGSALRSAPAIY